MAEIPQELVIIDRREAVRRVAALMGGAALIGGSALVSACGNDRRRAQAGVGLFSAADVAYLDEIAETILPETKTPGAKAARVGAFMALMVTDTYDPADQAIFRQGMQQLDAASVQANGASFMAAAPAQRLALLERLDGEQKAYQDARESADPNHYFRMMKELTLLGYFTSEIGCTQARRYTESPGRFDPCVPYAPGERAWADHA